MKRTLLLLVLVMVLCVASKAYAEEIPSQEISNSKGFAGINYDRQDSKQTGRQKIVNDHSAFNINIQIIKEGALLQKVEKTDGGVDEDK